MADIIARVLIFLLIAYAALGYGVPRLVRRGWNPQHAQIAVAIGVVIALFFINLAFISVR